MQLRLRHNLHWCASDGRAVFLDLAADRYFCLPAVANRAFLRAAAGRTRAGDRDHLHMLVVQEILTEERGPGGFGHPPAVEPPTGDFLDEPVTRPGPLDILLGLAAEARAAWLLHAGSFRKAIESAAKRSRRGRRARRDPDRSLQAIVAASRVLALVTGAHDRCLVRALAVYFRCRRYGIRPKLVIGVVAHPFTAHCWVQLGSKVLVGGFEQARLYTPILVIE